MKRHFLAALLAIHCSAGSAADEDAAATEPLTVIGAVVLGEAVFALNSYAASKDPVVVGSLYVLASPLGASSHFNDAGNLANAGALASIGVYNIAELRRDRYSEAEVFRANMYALHGFGVFVYIVGKTFGKQVPLDQVSIKPVDDGFAVSFRATF